MQVNKNTKSHEEFIQEISLVNDNLTVLGEYVNARTKIKVQCKKCFYEWEALPYNLKRGTGCPQCSKESFKEKRRMPPEVFLERAQQKYPDVIFLSEYVSQRQKIKCQCKLCQGFFEVFRRSVFANNPKNLCPHCRVDERPKARLSEMEFKQKVEKINSSIDVVGVFKTTRSKIELKCKTCGTKWEAIAANVLAGKVGCPKCAYSLGEKRVSQFLDNNNILYVAQKKFEECKDKRCLPFDFYLPEYNMCIEYDGAFHYSISNYHGGQEKFEYTKKHDAIKDKYCEENNIKLLRIPFFEYKKVEEILQRKLLPKGVMLNNGSQCNF